MMSKIDTDVRNFVNFMKGHICKSGDGKNITHTLMGNLHESLFPYKGRYNIEGVNYEKFLKLYQLVVPKMDMYVVERPKSVGPMVIDIDFKTHKKHSERQYLDKHPEAVIQIYNNLFKTYLDISTDEIKAFVFEKPSPTYEEKHNQWKDGFHIFYPEIPLDEKKRFFFFDKAKDEIIKKDVFSEVPFVNTYKEILDISVVKSNGILMYGSHKMDREPYGLTKVYNFDLSIDSVDNYDDDDLVNYFSIRRYTNEDNTNWVNSEKNNVKKNNNISGYDTSDESDNDSDNDSINSNFSKINDKNKFEIEATDIFESYTNPKLKKKQTQEFDYNSEPEDYKNDKRRDDRNDGNDGYNRRDKYDRQERNTNKYNNDNFHNKQDSRSCPQNPEQMKIKVATGLTRILNKRRCEEYNDWVKVGWVLHSVSPTLLPLYIEFSKKSKKFELGECEKIWKSASEHNNYKYTIATLYWWAREDNKDQLEKYLEVMREQLKPYVLEAKSGTHDDIANVVYEMFRHTYRCISVAKNMWYEFQGHRWVLVDNAYTLKEKIHKEVIKEFYALHGYYLDMAKNTGESEQDECVKQSAKIQKLYDKLKNNSFAKQVIECCSSKFFDQKFESSLNTNPLLIGFDNGVYDLERNCFRQGTPDDLISMTCGYDYKEYDMKSPEVKKIENFFSQVMREDDMRGYILRLISSFLDGRIKDQKFVLWTGHGCHEKDELIRMHDGSTKKIQDIKLKDSVLGSDGRERRVTVLYNGNSKMYRIEVNDDKNTNFTITYNHKLALRSHFIPSITSTYDDIYNVTLYWVIYHEMTHDGPIKMESKFYDKESAEKYLNELENFQHGTNYIGYGQIIPILTNLVDSIPDEILQYYKLVKYNSSMLEDSTFNIVKIEEKREYFGIELDGDKKYVMDNGYITYNSNGKSTTISLIHDTLGDYAGVLSSQVVTRKRGGAGQATPELADKIGKRFLVIQEPESDDQIYVGQMKELSAGNDKVPARALYGNPFYYKPQFKMVLCCNKLPTIPSNDGGTWRRLRVSPWETMFMDLDHKDKLSPNQFFKDPNLEDNMKNWQQPFMWLLINKYYHEYVKKGLCEPSKVTMYTDKYKKDSDVYLEFLVNHTETTRCEEDKESISVLYRLFKLWHKEAYNGYPAVPAQKDFINYIGNKYQIEKGFIKGIRLVIDEQ